MSHDWMADERHMLEDEWLDEIQESVHRRAHANTTPPDWTCHYCVGDEERDLHAQLAQHGIAVQPETFMALGETGQSLLAECLELLVVHHHRAP